MAGELQESPTRRVERVEWRGNIRPLALLPPARGVQLQRAMLATFDAVGRVEGADMQRRPLDGASPSLLRSRRSSDRSCISAPSICSWR